MRNQRLFHSESFVTTTPVAAMFLFNVKKTKRSGLQFHQGRSYLPDRSAQELCQHRRQHRRTQIPKQARFPAAFQMAILAHPNRLCRVARLRIFRHKTRRQQREYNFHPISRPSTSPRSSMRSTGVFKLGRSNPSKVIRNCATTLSKCASAKNKAHAKWGHSNQAIHYRQNSS